MPTINKDRILSLARSTGRGAKHVLSSTASLIFNTISMLDAGEFEMTINKDTGFHMRYKSNMSQYRQASQPVEDVEIIDVSEE
jgi:hypothetical protein